MLPLRIIPRLDIKGPNLVKGIHLEGLRVLGKPEQFARHYNEQGADELLFMDVVASLYGRNNLLEIVERTSRELFVPLTVGGGIRTPDDIRAVLRAGADKVAINTAAIRRPEFIREAAKKYGSSTLVVSIEAIRRNDGSYEAYTDNGRESTGIEAVEWSERAASLGAGEIIITSIDREGTGQGFDLELIRQVCERVDIPVVACGGAGRIEQILDLARDVVPQGIALASILHYRYVRESGSAEGIDPAINTRTLEQRLGFEKIADSTLPEIKTHLRAAGAAVRT